MPLSAGCFCLFRGKLLLNRSRTEPVRPVLAATRGRSFDLRRGSSPTPLNRRARGARKAVRGYGHRSCRDPLAAHKFPRRNVPATPSLAPPYSTVGALVYFGKRSGRLECNCVPCDRFGTFLLRDTRADRGDAYHFLASAGRLLDGNLYSEDWSGLWLSRRITHVIGLAGR